MADAKDAKVHQLDTRQATLGAKLRNAFERILQEPVPNEQIRLAKELGKALERKAAKPEAEGELQPGSEGPGTPIEDDNHPIKRDLRS
jgi:hypothetical protein